VLDAAGATGQRRRGRADLRAQGADHAIDRGPRLAELDEHVNGPWLWVSAQHERADALAGLAGTAAAEEARGMQLVAVPPERRWGRQRLQTMPSLCLGTSPVGPDEGTP